MGWKTLISRDKANPLPESPHTQKRYSADLLSGEQVSAVTSLPIVAKQGPTQNMVDAEGHLESSPGKHTDLVQKASLLAKAFALVRKDDAKRVNELFKVCAHCVHISLSLVLFVGCASSSNQFILTPSSQLHQFVKACFFQPYNQVQYAN